MNECMNEEIRDALLDMVYGRLSELDTKTLMEHIQFCAECRAELAVIREAQATAPIVPRIDAARVAAAIAPYANPASMSDADARKTARPVAMTWKFAAAALLISAGGWALSNTSLISHENESRGAASVAAVASTPSAEVAGRVTSEQSGATPEAPEPVTAVPTEIAALSIVGGVPDLTDDQLEALIQDLDAIESLPSGDPAPVTLSVDDMGGL
jgi:anti-sigma factor RsiW